MSEPPSKPRIYHITHVDNLASIVADACLWSDREQIARRPEARIVGMSRIKRRRLTRLTMSCHRPLMVGDFVPFNFCPRSFMLFVIHRASHPDLAYRGGQEPMLHFEADLHEVVRWADRLGRRWAVTVANAGSRSTRHFDRIEDLDRIDWDAVAARDFTAPAVKVAKQSEFLFHESFPWTLDRRIGVASRAIHARATAALANSIHRPLVEVLPHWYY